MTAYHARDAGDHGSYWIASAPGRPFPPLANRQLEVDVAVIGAGIVADIVE